MNQLPLDLLPQPDADGPRPAVGVSAPGRLLVHSGPRADVLAGALAELLAEPLDDPFATEVVSVPTPGVERWLAQTLAERLGPDDDGVCAGVAFPGLEALLDGVVLEATGAGERAGDPWHPRRLVWSCLRTFETVAEEPWFAPVASHLRGPADPDEPVGSGRRWGTARRLARLFAAYAAERPAMVDAWRAGRDVGSDLGPVPDDLAWQPRLWRALAAEVGTPDPARRMGEAVAVLRGRGSVTALPPRLSVFGPTRLNARQLRLLEALAVHREVHLWLPFPLTPPDRRGPLGLRADDPGRGRHRLTDRLGRDQRELRRVLGTVAAVHREHPTPAVEPSTVLARLQTDVLADRPPRPAAERAVWRADDRSLQLHSSHGPDRQVEVLRDVLLGLLADDPTLEPRDVVVMCPDIDTYAPLVQACFGLAVHDADLAAHPGHRLRVRLADRSLRQVNPLLELLVAVLDLTVSRAPGTALADLAAAPAVARRFGFRTDDHRRIAELLEQSGVRWGLDHLHRGQFGMSGFPQNTWAAGLARMLAGVALSEDGQPVLGTVLPLDGVDSSEVELVGSLAELVSRVRRAVTAFSGPQPVTGWVAAARQALESLVAVGSDEQWQLGHAFAQLADLVADLDPEQAPELSLADFRALLDDDLRGRPTRGSFRTGALTMCTLSPMRAVPHRVVCLLGLDDGVFPRPGGVDGDDLLARAPLVGDRDRVSEDRQLLLDAVLAARETLVLVHGGTDPRTGARRPDAVPLRELLDAVDETVRPRQPDGPPVSERIRVRHPLQPFAPANFEPSPGGGPPLSFDPVALRGARASVAPRVPAPELDLSALPEPPLPDVLELAELKRFLDHPGKEFLRTRLGLYPDDPDDGQGEEIPIELDGLQRWAVGNRVLSGALAGSDWSRLKRAEQLRGTVPPGVLGEQLLESVRADVDAILGVARVDVTEVPQTVEGRLTLEVPVAGRAQQVLLSGAVTGVRGDCITALQFSKLRPRYQLRLWLDLLLLSAARPEGGWRARGVGPSDRFNPPLELGPLPADRARTQLTRLVGIALDGRRRPAPLPVDPAAAYARARRGGLDDAGALGSRQWEGTLRLGFADEAWTRTVGSTRADLLEPDADPAERDSTGVRHRFGALALAVWEPLLAAREAR